MTVFKNRLMKNSSIIATLLLIILIATASFLSGRKIYSMERQRNLGGTGHVVFLSRTSGSYLYFQYMPFEVNEWRLALSVPEAAVFSTAEAVKSVLNLLSAFEIICFLLYFIWMFSYVRREASQKQRQVDTINSVYEIAKLLFGAHEHRENIGLALEQIADSLRETNNTHGHHAGDKLLRDTAEEIQRWFKGAYSYRIGGDEFVLFIPDMPREAVLHLCKSLESSLISKDIYISVGMHWSDRAIDIDSLMKTAENRMYASKREYYDKLKISDGQRQPLG